MAFYNPTFKPPASFPAQRMRSPSPPHAFVEPLSPVKPAPIEPNYNYPPLSSKLEHSTAPAHETYTTTTPKTQEQNGSHKSGHHRTPSSMATLAEVALNTARNTPQDTHSNTYCGVYSHGGSEPPHKRARSELLPSPFFVQHASRPATSYDGANGWHQNTNQHRVTRNTYDHRVDDRQVEEANLLLNFHTGGWSTNQQITAPTDAPGSFRPHANSFPSDHRPHPNLNPDHQLLPPFSPGLIAAAPAVAVAATEPALPSPQRTSDESIPSPKGHVNEADEQAVSSSPDVPAVSDQIDTEMSDAPQQTQTPPDEAESVAHSASTAPNDTPEVLTKSKRGWPKGKPRGTAGKRAEKAASKRAAATRKKVPDSVKMNKIAGASDEKQEHESFPQRRKSFGDESRNEDQESPDLASIRRTQSVPPDVRMIINGPSPSRPTRRPNKTAVDITCAGCATTRNGANGELDDWISCNGCKNWFHVDCAGFRKIHEVRDVDKYFCASCEPKHGKTTYVRKSTRAHASVDYAELQKGVLKTSEESNEHHYIQPIKDGTFQFDPESFPRIRPEMVTKEFFERSNIFIEPICIPAAFNPRPWVKKTQINGEKQSTEGAFLSDTEVDMLAEDFEYDTVVDDGQDGLDMVMPENLTVRQVCNLVGPDTPLDVIDVKTQNSGSKWTLSRWADYYEEDSDDKAIRNVISLEVSQTKLGRLLRRPKIVRDIDLQDDVWPQKEIEQGKYPKVQFYCLMSVADSYTDFHIDFGGSSVYYHILKGKKTFFFIPPKAKHLKAYEEWNDSPQQNYTFLPKITKECYRVDLSEGDTMLIPSGWIHAVWTPETSLVIGGNFLNRMSYRNQFKVVEIEKANETPMKFRYPFFQKIMWYTAIQYLQTDPLPPAVSRLFHDGKQFERELPVWADFEGNLADMDSRPGAQNARYYSQAEMDGLPDLVNFIFRTVMFVMGRVEGISADRMKRVNASIPKGHGEPLEVAKTFALWVAWKRGNEDPPAWAHPDAVLPNSKEEGPPKKLSARALKEMERKEAIAAYRVAPDRQSARVKNAVAAAAAAASAMCNGDGATNDAVAATPERASSNSINQNQDPFRKLSDLLTQEVRKSNRPHLAPSLMQAQPSLHLQPSTNAYSATTPSNSRNSALSQSMPLMMNGVASHHVSTPKTSVLGPKRVACDACRKRRIRCKHKDMVVQAAQSNVGSYQQSSLPGNPYQQSDVYENITVTPPRSAEAYNHFANSIDEQQTPNGHASPTNGPMDPHGQLQMQLSGPTPGTNAYINANIPMTMNGVPIFGEVPKRGRSKACFECRKSKRRCVHDEHGNVDPVKAAETPVPRGSMTSRKRSSIDNATPTQSAKRPRPNDGTNGFISSTNQHPTPSSGTPEHAFMQEHPSYQPAASVQANPNEHDSVADHPAIDPNLFSMHAEPANNNHFESHQYDYSAGGFPSLEQIANEVLDMNEHEPQDRHTTDQGQQTQQPNGYTDPSSVAIKNRVHSQSNASLQSTHSISELFNFNSDINNGHEDQLHDQSPPDSKPIIASPDSAKDTSQAHADHQVSSGLGHVQTSVEASPTAVKSIASELPLYRPPAPLSQSPEATKRQTQVNGFRTGSESDSNQNSKTPNDSGIRKTDVPTGAAELSSIELAKALQQEDLGLRRRSK